MSARFTLYEGIQSKGSHFSDRGVALADTMDHTVYGLGVERRLLAFRCAYSILDKIALFLRKYLSLPSPLKTTNFRTIWFRDSGQVRTRVVHEALEEPAWPFVGLFWMSRDLHDDDQEFVDSLEPDSQQLHHIRNHIEHRCVRVHEDGCVLGAFPWEAGYDAELESEILSIPISTLDEKCVRLLSFVRDAIVMLALGLMITEGVKRTKVGDSRLPSLRLRAVDDSEKL